MGVDNALEAALRAAAEDPGRRPAFYKLLLESEVFALGSAELDAEGNATRLKLVPWNDAKGNEILPIFSSLERLRKAITQEGNYVQINARSLFEATIGARLVLNPNSAPGKEFTPEEIAALLDGSLFARHSQEVVKEDRQVLLGQPKEYPQALVDGLKSLYATLPGVRAAYLALLSDPSRTPEQSLLVGVDTGDDENAFQEALGQAGVVVRDTLPKEQAVDFIPIGSDNLSDYLLQQTEAFYKQEK